MPENCSQTLTSNCCDLSNNGKYKWPTFTISEANIDLLNINLGSGMLSMLSGSSSNQTPSPTTSSWQSYASGMLSTGENMMESGTSNTIQLNKNALQDLLNNDIIKYFNDNLPGYLNCTIKQIGTDLDNNQYDDLINSLKDKVIDTLNGIDLSVLNPLLNNLDTIIVNHINSQLTAGTYNTLIDNFLENITNKLLVNLNNNTYDTLISNFIAKIKTILNNDINQGNFDNIFGSLTKKITSTRLFIGIIGVIVVIFIQFFINNLHLNKIENLHNKLISNLNEKFNKFLEKR